MYLAGLDISAIPFKTDRTLRKVPYVTYALLFINLFIYLAFLGRSNYDLYQIASQYGFVVSHPSLLTLFTSAFMHTDFMHLAGNLLILWLVGTVLETGIGSTVFLLLYLAGLVCATTLYGVIGKVFLPGSLDVPLIGASGAISGITGLAAFRYYRVRVLTIPLVAFPPYLPIAIPVPALVWVPMWAYAVLFAFRELTAGFSEIQGHEGTMVAHWAHIGGLALGVLMALIMNVAQEGKREAALEDSTRATNGGKTAGRSLQDVEALLRATPNDPELLEAMGGLLLAQGDAPKSRAHYLKAVRLFLAGGQRDRASISYLNVLRSFPKTLMQPREQITLASTLESLGYFAEAAQAFTLIIDHFADREEAQTALLRTALIHQRYLNDRAGAERLLRTFLERYPQSHYLTLAQDRLRELAGK